MGFGLDTDAIHSPNEHFGVSNFFNGIENYNKVLFSLCESYLTIN